ncbi:unnamed protein product [Adineta steineri]|uniref:Uncharacterized protein n=1 Tax=Adineta steineri TaxID=433720 RepID=A0A813SH32_9BILA|nr:unnamed protein product [Adineta steineri]CAF3908637.1 unnamed protein product [Adineta steineri]
MIVLNICSTNETPTERNDNQIDHCRPTMTLDEAIRLLREQPCLFLGKQNGSRVKRDQTAGKIDIKALQATVNDHRSMINVMMNNSMNATFIDAAFINSQKRTGPILTSWRDLVDLVTIAIFIGIIAYYCFCRSRCNPCHKIILYLFKPLVNNIEEKQAKQQQQQPEQPIRPIVVETPRRHQQRWRSPITSMNEDIVHFNNGYMSD